MTRFYFEGLVTLVSAVCIGVTAQPAVDHHQHLFRGAISPPPGYAQSAPELIRQMDEAGIRRGVVLSIAYQFGNPFRPVVENEYERVKDENDWTAIQAALYPGRLIAFCGVNPLKDYALQEIDRCAADRRLSRGLKLHFGNSDVRLDNPAHMEQVRRVFALANRHRLAIVVHVRPNINNRRPWGAEQARLFVEGVLPAAKDVVVQIAHLASAGGYEDDGAEQAMGFFAESIAKKDPRMKRVYFDVSVQKWESKRESLIRQLRAVGMKRLLFASDSPPLAAYQAFRKLPLSKKELRRIERNVAPYLR